MLRCCFIRLPLALLLMLSPLQIAKAGLYDMLMVVANPASLTTQESYRKSGFEGYGYTVTLIDDDASQASYNTALAGKNVAYVPESITSGSLGTKLKSTTIGVVVEEPNSADEFGFSDATFSTTSKNFIAIQSVTNYITYGFAGNLTILTANRPLARRTGTLAAGAVNLASVESSTAGSFNPGLLVLEVGASLYGGGTAAGRRVLLPVGDGTFDISLLNTSGQNLFRRAVEWAARPNPAVGNLLFVVTSTSSPTSQETTRRLLIETWGYNVTLIDDDATQATFNTTLAGKGVVYVSEEILVGSVSTKLTSTSVGVVNEDHSLSDEFGMSTTSAAVSATSITISDNSHYITADFSTGALTVFTSSQEAAMLTGTFAAGLQTLATVGTAKSLAVVESGALLTSGVAAGRRVQLPWGGSAFDFSAANTNAKTIMRRAIEWAASPTGTRVLLVAADSTSLSTQELARKTMLQSWSYSVNIIDDGAAQASFDSALLGNTVVYISEEVSSGTVSTKLRSAVIGIVSEEAFLADEFGISSSQGTSTGSSLTITNGTHYITSTIGAGAVTIFTSSQAITNLAGTFAPEMQVLAQWGSNRSLVAIEAGAELYDGSTAAGRRVQLPWGDSAFDFNTLNSNGQTLLKRSIEWASGLVGYWKLDETSGSTASDYSGYRNHGTVAGGLSFATDSINPGKLGRALQFDGSADYISINNATSLQPTTALSIAAWIKGDTWGSGSYANSILRKGDANPNNYQLAIAGSGMVQLSLDDGDDAGFRGNTTLQTGTWYHVAATWDGTTVRIYVNGVLDRTPPQTHTSPIGADSRTVYLGGRSGSTDMFDGTIDDVRIYNYALDATEITALKGQGQPKGVRVLKWIEVQ